MIYIFIFNTILRIDALEEAPFTFVVKYISSQFNVSAENSAITTNNGVGINPNQSAGSVFMKYGGDLKLIPREQVGSFRR